MNMSSSECTSGCESGWTMYLDQSVNSGYDDEKCEKGGRHSNGKWPYVSMERDEEDEDDLSMVSDASSGPRQKFDEDEEHKYGFDYGAQTTNKARSKLVRLNEKKTSNDVDDTASSTYISKAKSGLLKKGSSVSKKCVSNKSGEIKKGCDFAAQGSRELGSARKN